MALDRKIGQGVGLKDWCGTFEENNRERQMVPGSLVAGVRS
jgi:hypothetical protein